MLLHVLVEHRLVVSGNQGQQALGTTQYSAEGLLGAIFVTTLEGPDQPRVERIVPGAIGDVGDAGQELAVERDARRLDPKVIEATDRWWWHDPPRVDLRGQSLFSRYAMDDISTHQHAVPVPRRSRILHQRGTPCCDGFCPRIRPSICVVSSSGFPDRRFPRKTSSIPNRSHPRSWHGALSVTRGWCAPRRVWQGVRCAVQLTTCRPPTRADPEIQMSVHLGGIARRRRHQDAPEARPSSRRKVRSTVACRS